MGSKETPASAIGWYLTLLIFQVLLEPSGRNGQEAFALHLLTLEEDPPANPPNLLPVILSAALA